MDDISIEVRELVENFEKLWRAKKKPAEVDAVLAWSEQQHPQMDDRSRRWLITRLISLDLEYRWRNAATGGREPTRRLEDYPRAFAKLGSTWPDELVAAEYRARRTWGDRPEHGPFLERFPRPHDSLKALLERIDGKAPTGAPGAEPGAPPPEFPALDGFEVIECLGRGGMGIVYKARQTTLGRLVAIKMILSDRAGPQAIERFLVEARAVSRLEHPNIVRLYEIHEEVRSPFFALEFCPGGSLDKLIRHEPLDPRRAAEVVQQLAEAVHFAHERGIVHRDLKPANVLLDDAGVPKVADFGLAKLAEDDSDRTQTGQILGTPNYMAPEQAGGAKGQVGASADIYSLGATLYALLTASPPFVGSSQLDILDLVRTREPVPPSQLAAKVPVDLETICLKCLRKEPSRRYADAGKLAADLDRFLTGRPIQARPVGPRERLMLWCRRNPRIAGLAGTVALLLVAVTIVSVTFGITNARDRDTIAGTNQTLNTANARLTQTNVELDQKKSDLESSNKSLDDSLKREKKETDRANSNATESLAGLLAARSELARTQRPELLTHSARLAALSLSVRPTVEADRTLRQSLELLAEPVACMEHTNAQFALPFKGQPNGREYRPMPERLVFSPDNRRLAVLAGGNARVWDARSGSELLQLHPAFALLAYRTGGNTLTAVGNSTACTWNQTDGKLVNTIEFPRIASAVAMSSSGDRIASAGSDGFVRLWNVLAPEDILRFPAGPRVKALEFNQKGTHLAAADEDHVIVWDLGGGQKSPVKLPHTARVERIVWNPAGTRLATVANNRVSLWDLAGAKIHSPAPAGVQFIRPIHALAYNPDGRLFAAGGSEGTRVWSTADSSLVHSIDQPTQVLAFDAAGMRLALAGPKGLQIWRTEPWANETDNGWVRNRMGDFRGLRFSRDGGTLWIHGINDVARWPLDETRGVQVSNDVNVAAESEDGSQFALFGASIGTLYRRGGFPPREVGIAKIRAARLNQGIHSLGFSDDGRHIAVRFGMSVRRSGFGADGKYSATKELRQEHDDSPRVIEIANGREVLGDDRTSIVGKTTFHVDIERILPRSPEAGALFAASADGKREVAVTDEHLRVFDRDSKRESSRFPFTAWANDAEFSSGNSLLATADDDRTARVWNLDAGREVVRMIHEQKVMGVSLSPDGSLVATTGSDGLAWVWKARSHGELLRLAHDSAIETWTLGASPDGKRIWATASGAKVTGTLVKGGVKQAARVWDADTGNPLAEYAFEKTKEDVVYSPDGRFFAAVKDTGAISVREMATGNEVATFHSGQSTKRGPVVAFSPDGKLLATARDEGMIKFEYPSSLVEIWKHETKERVFRAVSPRHVTAIEFSHDGRRFIAVSGITSQRNPGAAVWDVQSQSKVADLAGEPSWIGAQFVGRDTVVTWSSNKFQAWKAETWLPLDSLQLPRHLTAFAFSPDGRFLAVASGERGKGDRDLAVHLWTIGSRAPAVVVPQEDQIGNMAFGPDSDRFATCSGPLQPWPIDYSARIWKIESDPVLRVVERARIPHPGPVTNVLFDPVRKRLITGGADGLIRVWPLEAQDLIEFGGKRLTRNLTPLEWSQSMPAGKKYTKLFANLP